MALLTRINLAAIAAVLFFDTGCKPTPPATAQATPPTDSSAPRQPTAADFQTFFQGMLPATVKVSEVKMDPPTRMPNASPASNVWLLSLKITVTPIEDLFSLPPPQDMQPIDNLVTELNALVAWRNTYANSPYAKACGAFEVKMPTAPLPQLLVITYPRDHPLPPIYAKVTAEWQVDHWKFEPAEGNTNTVLLNAGKLRSEFTGPTMVNGSHEAEQAIGGVRDAVTQARKEIDAIRSHYTEQVVRGVKPGTFYTGTVSYGPNVAPCELRFLDLPPGGDVHFANFQVTLPSQNPPCWYIYKARVTTDLPIPVPGPQPTPVNPYAVTGFNDANSVPTRNVFQNLVRNSNNKVGRNTLANWLSNNDHGGQGLLLLDGRIEGLINDFGNPGIKLSVKQNP